MSTAVNDVLKEAALTNKKLKAPSPLEPYEITTMTKLCELLRPLCTLTNELQADEVTSSLVILGVTNAYKSKKMLRTDFQRPASILPGLF